MKKAGQVSPGFCSQAPEESWSRRSHLPPPGVQVFVSRLDAVWERLGLARDRLLAEVEFRLAQGGVPLGGPVPPGQAWGGSLLGIMVDIQADHRQGIWPFSLELFYLEGQGAAEAPRGLPLNLHWWGTAAGEVASGGQEVDWSPLYADIARLLEEFIQEYHATHSLPHAPCRVN